MMRRSQPEAGVPPVAGETIGPRRRRRAREIETQMTDDERFSLLVGVMGAGELWPLRDERIPPGVPMSAGYVPGIPRLGVPALLMSDAGLGVTNPGYRPGDTATALPAGLALAASFNPTLARAAGEAIGREARSRGFNVQLAGAMNLARDPRNGRNFEYLSEDPLLSATMAAESINGIQATGCHLDGQALLAELQRDQPALAGRGHRSRRASRVRLAGFRDRHRAVAARRGDDGVQQGQRRLRLRKPCLDQRRAERCLGIPRLGHVRLGRARRAGSARFTASTRSAVPRSTPCSGSRRRSPTACAPPTPTARCPKSACRTWSGGSCVRCSLSESTSGKPRRHRIWPRTTRLRCR